MKSEAVGFPIREIGRMDPGAMKKRVLSLVRSMMAACLALACLGSFLLGVWLLVFDCFSGASFAFLGVVVFCPLGGLSARVWVGRGILAMAGVVGLVAGFPYLVGEVNRKIQRLSAIPRAQGDLSRFTLKDKLGIYGLNLAMGAVAWPLYPEVSRETLWMVRPAPDGLRTLPSDFALGSERVRGMLETFRARMPIEADAPDKKWEGRVAWPLGEYALGHREARYALALNPSRVSLWSLRGERHRTIHGEVSVRVEYPASCRVRLLAHPELAVEEGLFWVLQQEGWLHPYTATWTFAVSRDDPRLRSAHPGK